MAERYYDLKTYFSNQFGCRVHKISLDAGLTCPNRDGTLSTNGCIYCNSRGSGTGAHQRGRSIKSQLENGKTALARRYGAKKFIAYFQSFSNTYAPVARLAQLYDEALAVDDVVGLSVGTRPDCINEPVLELLSAYARRTLVWVEYGMQSAHDDTLTAINRRHDFNCFSTAVEQTRRRGIAVCAHVILGLPTETRRHIRETADAIAGLEIDGVKLHLLYVVKETRLAELYRTGRYRCLSQRSYVDWVCDFLERLPPGTVIQRLTGDPHPRELIAPQWALRKNETLAMIQDTLRRRHSRQGARWAGLTGRLALHK